MITTHHNRRLDFAFPDQVVDGQAKLRPFAIAQPANAGGESLELDTFAGQADPSAQNAVVGEQFKHQIIGNSNIGRVAGERRPAERTASFAKQWTDIGRNKAGEIVSILDSPLKSEGPYVVAVVEGHATHFLKP